MKKLTIAAIATAMVLSVMAPAQSNGTTTNGMQNSSMISSGPWMMRRSTGDKMVDRLWFISDRTLNAAEMDTLRTMFRNMPGNTGYTLQKAIISAIDQNASANANYGSWS